MATTKNRMIIDTTMNVAMVASPLRRKSILQQNSSVSKLSENDDEAERLAHRHRMSAALIPSSPSTNNKRRSSGIGLFVNMSTTQMAERISQCIKLGIENKINLKNAFSLGMIDYMAYMIRKQDVNMSNLQVASTSLDVSTKIYGFRVDGVHMEILKLVSGQKNESTETNRSQANDTDTINFENENMNELTKKQEKKKKKKRNKQQIFASVEALKTNVQTEKPSLVAMEADLQSTDTLYQTVLPNHANSGFYLHQYNDILVDTVEHKNKQNNVEYSVPRITDFSHMEICPPLVYFDFQNWNADDEDVSLEKTLDDCDFQYDLNASLPQDDEPVYSSVNYFDIEETDQENIDKCAKLHRQVENIVDFREAVTHTAEVNTSEYSFIQKNLHMHWAGPSHWKVTTFKKTLSNSGVIETCRQAPGKKKKEIELCYDDEVIEGVSIKFQSSQRVEIHPKTLKIKWNEEVLVLPLDEHYDIAQANKLYLHTIIRFHSESKDDLNATHLSGGINNYNYENTNDISDSCPGVNNEENDAHDDDIRFDEEGMIRTGNTAFTGINLVTLPKLTAKSTITYSVRAKKIDMRQLKKSIWKCLTLNDEKSNTDLEMMQNSNSKMTNDVYFSNVYKKLPNILTKTNTEALSFPISFVSLLHLANEKSLKVTTSINMSDIIIQQD